MHIALQSPEKLTTSLSVLSYLSDGAVGRDHPTAVLSDIVPLAGMMPLLSWMILPSVSDRINWFPTSHGYLPLSTDSARSTPELMLEETVMGKDPSQTGRRPLRSYIW